MSSRNRTVRFAACILPNAPITPDVMVHLFEAKTIVQGTYKKPNAIALRKLAECAEFHRRVFRIAPIAIAAARHMEKFQDGWSAAQTHLHRAVKAYGEMERTFSEFDIVSDGKETTELNGLRKKFMELADDAKLLLASFGWLIPVITSPYPHPLDEMPQVPGDTAPSVLWHELTGRLVPDFRTAMRSTNRDRELKVSNKGPIVRFVVSVTPLITGETPSDDAVARWLQRKGEVPRDNVRFWWME